MYARLGTWVFIAVVAAICLFVLMPIADRHGYPTRIQTLEDRQSIEELLTAYGSTLDRHDFAAFGQLFAQDAVYSGGPGTPVHGRDAIQASLEKTISGNPSHLPMPAFHLFFNRSIQVEGDHATAHSKGAYVIPDERTNGAQIIFLVDYDDVLVRREGRWLFQQRTLHSGIPAPAGGPR